METSAQICVSFPAGSLTSSLHSQLERRSGIMKELLKSQVQCAVPAQDKGSVSRMIRATCFFWEFAGRVV